MIGDHRQNFDPDYIKKELMELDAVLIEKLSIYLIGGVVMEINDLKPEEILSQSKNTDYAE